MPPTTKHKLVRHSSEMAKLDAQSPFSQHLIARIKEVRLQRGLKQEDVARKAGVSREALLRLEGGQADSRISTFDNLLKGLGLLCEFNLVTNDSTRLLVAPQLTMAAAPASPSPLGVNITIDDIRRVFLANGFTIKEGQSDLKPYVFTAAKELLKLGWNGTPITDTRVVNHMPSVESYQTKVAEWMDACFGPEISADVTERNHRFCEESIELVQALGMTKAEVLELVDYTFDRPVGEHEQEVGGVMVTLAALCDAHKIDMHELGERELARVWTRIDQIRAKQAAKPKFGSLPVKLEPRATVNQPVQLVAAGVTAWAESLKNLRERVIEDTVECTDASLALATEIFDDAVAETTPTPVMEAAPAVDAGILIDSRLRKQLIESIVEFTGSHHTRAESIISEAIRKASEAIADDEAAPDESFSLPA